MARTPHQTSSVCLASPLLPAPQLRAHPTRRRPCLSAIWSEPTLRKQQRRAVHSWSPCSAALHGYGTLVEEEVTSAFHQVPEPKPDVIPEGGGGGADTVADSATLLEPRARRLNTGLPGTHGPRPNRSSNLLNNMPGRITKGVRVMVVITHWVRNFNRESELGSELPDLYTSLGIGYFPMKLITNI